MGPHVPPVFLWHTVADEAVPVENSLMFMTALQRAKVPFEAHLYPDGQHGLSLGDVTTNQYDDQQKPYIQNWINHVEKWLRTYFPL